MINSKLSSIKIILTTNIILTFFLLSVFANTYADDFQQIRDKAIQLQKDGNYKDAVQLYKKLLSQQNNDSSITNHIQSLYDCYTKLNNNSELENYLKVLEKTHSQNWLALSKIADIYSQLPYYGYIINNEFKRGRENNKGKYIYIVEHDRITSLRLFQKATDIIENQNIDISKNTQAAKVYQNFANIILKGRSHENTWRLEELTDIKTPPDYKTNITTSSNLTGFPVDADDNPIIFTIPESFEKSKNDGERWRWLLHQGSTNTEIHADCELTLANFFYEQFNVTTINNPRHFQHNQNKKSNQKNHILTLHTLSENETIAKLATGIKRFKMDDDFNFIKIYQDLANYKNDNQEIALNKLAQIFQNRRQFKKAKTYWQRSIAIKPDKNKKNNLEQITGNIGRFEPTSTQPPPINNTNSKIKFDFTFRNATEVHFTAHKINLPKILDYAKTLIQSNPIKLDYRKLYHNRSQIGNFLLTIDSQKEYLESQVADWQEILKPYPDHWDKLVTIESPLKQPGAYLLTAKVKNGNTSKQVIWIEDTAVIKKRMKDKTLFIIADSSSGNPLPGASLNFFGYQEKHIQYTSRNFKKDRHRANIITTEKELISNEYGQCFFSHPDNENYRWLISAQTQKDNRFTLLDVQNIRSSHKPYQPFRNLKSIYDDYKDFKFIKIFTITDRPIYRPNQTVHIHSWIKYAKYGNNDNSQFTNKKLDIRIYNPQHQTIYEKEITTDKNGAIQFDFKIPENAKLGNYVIHLSYYRSEKHRALARGNLNFKVEEYKKPEFEVKVIALEKPIKLGDKFTATIQAKYYFGKPVNKGTLKYKVLRRTKNNIWFPPMPWDWLYDEGYFWNKKSYSWHPTWNSWRCILPSPNYYNPTPEIIEEKTIPLTDNGKTEIKIDTSTTKEIYGDHNYEYEITAEVTDKSRHTIYNTGKVLVASKPFDIKVWTDKSYYNQGDTVKINAQARTPDGKPVTHPATINIFQIHYNQKTDKITETNIYSKELTFNADGIILHKITATQVGQYRISCIIKNNSDNIDIIEGATMTTVRGDELNDNDLKYNDLEISLDKKNYKVGDEVKVLINSSHPNAYINLFIRPENNNYPTPIVLQLGENSSNPKKSKSKVYTFKVKQSDIPKINIEALTIVNGKVYTETAKVLVPPASKILNLKVTPESKSVPPSEKQKLNLKLTDNQGNPISGNIVITVYDKALEYISGPGFIPNINKHFWYKYSESFTSSHTSNIMQNYYSKQFKNIVPYGEPTFKSIGVFGSSLTGVKIIEDSRSSRVAAMIPRTSRRKRSSNDQSFSLSNASSFYTQDSDMALAETSSGSNSSTPSSITPQIRKNFADLAYWETNITTDQNGKATVEFPLPDDLTTWKIKAWAMGKGTKVGEAESEFTTSKNFIIRLQAPRFFVQNDEAVLSANIHNYLKSPINSDVSLELEGNTLSILENNLPKQTATIPNKGDSRIDWRVKANSPGNALIRMNALTNIESDAIQKDFPVYIHGIDKTDSQSGFLSSKQTTASFSFNIPSERKPEHTKLELHYTPSIASTIVNSIPYLTNYKYACTEQTLNRFVPATIIHKFLEKSGFNPESSNNEKLKSNPIFNTEKRNELIYEGLKLLEFMQNNDGGWEWFSGSQESSYPHTTATVIRGLIKAKKTYMDINGKMLTNGIDWLFNFQQKEVTKLNNWHIEKTKDNKKQFPSNIDAFIHHVLTHAIDFYNGNIERQKFTNSNNKMEEYLYKYRNELSLYSKSLLALAIHQKYLLSGNGKIKTIASSRVNMLRQNIEQFLQFDNENQTAYLLLQNNNFWWRWYGNEMETHAFYLKLLALTKPQSKEARGIAKYIINNRNNVNYWNSTRDTALCIEALTEYLANTMQENHNLKLDILLDGKKYKTVNVNKDNLFSFDNTLKIKGQKLTSGKHSITFKKSGNSPLYYNSYLSYFTLENYIAKSGLEVKVERNYYKLTEIIKNSSVPNKKGNVVNIKTKNFQRTKLPNFSEVKSGDLLEVELILTSKNDYEYIIVEDMKAAGTEPVDNISGYTSHSEGISAYRELRDERVAFFIHNLPLGQNRLAYKIKAITLGKFHALPTTISSMYNPKLKGNSDETIININP